MGDRPAIALGTPATIAPFTVDGLPWVDGASVPEPSFAYTDLRGIGKIDIDDLLDYVHETARGSRPLFMGIDEGSVSSARGCETANCWT